MIIQEPKLRGDLFMNDSKWITINGVKVTISGCRGINIRMPVFGNINFSRVSFSLVAEEFSNMSQHICAIDTLRRFLSDDIDYHIAQTDAIVHGSSIPANEYRGMMSLIHDNIRKVDDGNMAIIPIDVYINVTNDRQIDHRSVDFIMGPYGAVFPAGECRYRYPTVPYGFACEEKDLPPRFSRMSFFSYTTALKLTGQNTNHAFIHGFELWGNFSYADAAIIADKLEYGYSVYERDENIDGVRSNYTELLDTYKKNMKNLSNADQQKKITSNWLMNIVDRYTDFVLEAR